MTDKRKDRIIKAMARAMCLDQDPDSLIQSEPFSPTGEAPVVPLWRLYEPAARQRMTDEANEARIVEEMARAIAKALFPGQSEETLISCHAGSKPRWTVYIDSALAQYRAYCAMQAVISKNTE